MIGELITTRLDAPPYVCGEGVQHLRWCSCHGECPCHGSRRVCGKCILIWHFHAKPDSNFVDSNHLAVPCYIHAYHWHERGTTT